MIRIRPDGSGSSGVGKASGRRGTGILILLTALCVAIEAVLVLSDLGLIAHGRLRQLAYAYGGFWPGLLQGWQPNFAGQPWAMFLTHGFLHGGIAHLGFNMVTLWSLGRPLLDAGGRARFLAIWAVAQFLGGCAYAGLWSEPRPMVGASGALFGLAGAWLAAIWNDPADAGESRHLVLWIVALLAGLNLAMVWALDGQLAWQTHLGGFAGGWIVAVLTGLAPPGDQGSERAGSGQGSDS
ncbi:rhomboid family intramembrane serine protease [Paracoccus sp. MC1854]|uniref:rhomboid family intramembrane serine protease n=1 Tax=Paracoccus sp. MC1854 TaxID=2760306 RepID=UPI00351C93D6